MTASPMVGSSTDGRVKQNNERNRLVCRLYTCNAKKQEIKKTLKKIIGRNNRVKKLEINLEIISYEKIFEVKTRVPTAFKSALS